MFLLTVQAGDRVAEGDRLVILEAIKTQIAVFADSVGTVAEVFCEVGQIVTAGQLLVAIQPITTSGETGR